MSTPLEQFYEVMIACGMKVPDYEVWARHYSENAELWPIEKEGRLIGGILFKGHMIHIAVHPEWHGRWLTKAMLRGYQQWTPECDVLAMIPKENAEAIELARRLGFVRKAPINSFEVFIKEQACLQQ